MVKEHNFSIKFADTCSKHSGQFQRVLYFECMIIVFYVQKRYFIPRE